MKLQKVFVANFKGFLCSELDINGKSTVIFGVNGTGKSTVLSAINYCFWTWLYRMNQSQGVAYRSFEPKLVHQGRSQLVVQSTISLDGQDFTLFRAYTKPKAGKKATSFTDKKTIDQFLEAFSDLYLPDEEDMPIFVNYGTNRSVLDIPLRIRQKHQFTKLTALERALENELDFRTFFEWYRNQEDIENEYIRESGDYNYQDRYLKCVRFAIEAMLGNVSNLKVKRSPLRMTVNKGKTEVSVDQLSDGEKCTLALFGDLARRIALANPNRENPLEGSGIVLIDEIELHMHPSWQRRVLNVLKEVFPNIQFIVTTHSPQVLSEVGEDCAIFMLSPDMQKGTIDIQTIKRMDGFSSNEILEEYMNTRSENPAFTQLVKDASNAIQQNDFIKAEQLISLVQEAAGEDSAAAIRLEGLLKRGRILYAKNH